MSYHNSKPHSIGLPSLLINLDVYRTMVPGRPFLDYFSNSRKVTKSEKVAKTQYCSHLFGSPRKGNRLQIRTRCGKLKRKNGEAQHVPFAFTSYVFRTHLFFVTKKRIPSILRLQVRFPTLVWLTQKTEHLEANIVPNCSSK